MRPAPCRLRLSSLTTLNIVKFVAISAFLISILQTEAGAQKQETLRHAAIADPFNVIETISSDLKLGRDNVLPRSYTINTCMYSDDYSLGDNKYQFLNALSVIAHINRYTEEDLASAGYPKFVWENALSELTQKQVAAISKLYGAGKNPNDIAAVRLAALPYERKLLSVLNAYRRQKNTKLPRYEIGEEHGCGGDWVGLVRIRTIPPNGKVKLIREHFFLLCQKKSIDPYSAQCDMWLEANSKAIFPQGTYRYRVRWENGAEECNKVELVKANADVDRVDVTTIRETKEACSQ